MNKKLLPLLGIAFVVAVIATGIFYGLIAGRLREATNAGPQRPLVVAARSLEPGTVLTKADLRVSKWVGEQAPKDAISQPEQVEGWTVLQAIGENEPVIRTRLATSQAGGAALAIPSGMRAVSIQTPDSPGVLRLLRPGHRVDVQAVRTRGSRSGEGEIRTILQDVEVLSVPEAKESRQAGGAVVTVLAKPSDAELLSLADATARVRVVLRNPIDRESQALRGGDLVSLFQNRPAPAAVRASSAKTAPALQPAAVMGPRVRFDLRVAGAGPAAIQELSRHALGPRGSRSLQVAALRANWDLEQSLQRLQAEKELEILSSSSLVTADNVPVAMQTGAAACGVRVELAPSIRGGRKLWLKIEGGAAGAEAELEATDGQGLLITGLAGSECSPERLYAGRAAPPGRREVVVLLTPRISHAAEPKATAVALQKP